MNLNRKCWNQKQKNYGALTRPSEHQKAIGLFLNQHAMVHSAKMSRSKLWSFEDEIWQGLEEEAVRRIPRGGAHSIAWIIWHITRIEDVTMNLLVAGTPQIFQRDKWMKRMKITPRDTGNAMDENAIAKLSATIDIAALRTYRLAVGRRTRQIVKRLKPEELQQKVDPARLQRVMTEVAVVDAASGVVDYWGKRTIAGLLLMPPTRHCFLHLNEALRVKPKCLREDSLDSASK
jgi:hypothetical protein